MLLVKPGSDFSFDSVAHEEEQNEGKSWCVRKGNVGVYALQVLVDQDILIITFVTEIVVVVVVDVVIASRVGVILLNLFVVILL